MKIQSYKFNPAINFSALAAQQQSGCQINTPKIPCAADVFCCNKKIQKNPPLSFGSIFNKPRDVRRLGSEIHMNPNLRYLVDDNAAFSFDDFELDFSKEPMSKLLKCIKKGKSLVIEQQDGRVASRKIIKITKNKKGQFIAQNLAPEAHGKIKPNIIYNSEDCPFDLKSGMWYFLPSTSVLSVGAFEISLEDYKEILDKMSRKDVLTIGRSHRNKISIPDINVSPFHLQVEKRGRAVLVKDLGSKEGTRFLRGKKQRYVDDFSNYSTVQSLVPKRPTKIPPDCQLYLGSELTIDMRNKNILDLLYKKGAITIGRGENCDLVVPSFYDYVSEEHLSLQKTGDEFTVTEFDSANGTKVVPKNCIKAFYGKIEDINVSQGNVGDCYLIAAMYSLSLSKVGQNLLRDMVSVDDKGNYTVKFFNRKPIVVPLHELDGQKKEDGSSKRSVSGDLGFKAIERAYAKMIKKWRKESMEEDHTMFLGIDMGGYVSEAIDYMTGLKSHVYSIKNIDLDILFGVLEQQGFKNYLLNCTTPSEAKYGDGKYVDSQKRFIKEHAYTIKSVDMENKIIEIVNPHNTKISYRLSFERFQEYFKSLYTTFIPEALAQFQD